MAGVRGYQMTSDVKKETRRRFFRYAVPSALAMWIYSAGAMIDGMIVSRGVNTTALAALNLCMPFIDTVFAMGMLFAVGAGTKASYYKGRGDPERANEVFTLNAAVVFLLALAVSAAAFFNLDKLAFLLGADKSTEHFVKSYLSVMCLFAPFYMFVYNFEVLVKADGLPRLAITAVSAGTAVDILLEYVFVIVCKSGMKGAALAAGLAQVAAFSIFAAHFLRNKKGFRFVRIRFKIKETINLAKLGTADFVNEFSIGAVIFMFNNILVRTVGNEGVVIYTAIAYVAQFILMTMMGINQGMEPLVSFYRGKGETPVYRCIFKTALLSAGVSSVAFFLFGALFPGSVVGAFIDKSRELPLYLDAIFAFRLFSLSFLPMGAAVILGGYFTALEIPKYAAAVSIGRGLVFAAAALVLMARLFGETGIWLSMTVSESAALALAVFFYRKTFRNGREEKEKPGRTAF